MGHTLMYAHGSIVSQIQASYPNPFTDNLSPCYDVYLRCVFLYFSKSYKGHKPFMKTDPNKGYFCVMAAAVLWASSGTAGKALFMGGISPLDVVQIRISLSVLVLFVLISVLHPRYLRIRLRDLAYFLVLGGLFAALVQLSYFYAISKIQVAAAILLQYLAPIIVAFIAICFWKEHLTVLKLAALFLALFGCYLVVGGYDLNIVRMNKIGIMWGLISAGSFAGYTLLSERGMHRYPPWTVLFYSFLFATLSLSIVQNPSHYIDVKYSASQWGWLLYIAIAGTMIPFGLYFTGINYIRSTRTIITATLEPISAALIAYVFLGETFEIIQITGGISVVCAVVLLQLQREHDDLAPESIRSQLND